MEVAIKIQDLTFAYKEHQILFSNLSLEIFNHQVTAIVGATGSGKSTILKLIEGLYPLNSGQIYIFGQELNAENKLSIRQLISISFQDTYLFNQTLKENILFGNPEATDEELNKVLEVALIDQFISKLPDGINTILGENGVKLSGGERQRVGLARALLRNPKILLLDEATSALDNETEKKIVKNIQNNYQDTTCVIVAHRLNTIENADTIIVLDKGKIVEIGNHSQLIANNSIYKKLYNITKEI
jgi:ABC-type multidrug transport system fused ATPase/permease subunit